MDQLWARQEIMKEMKTLKADNLEDIQKEALLMSIIQSDESGLLDILMKRVSIDNLKVCNETPLIYAIQKGKESIIKSLIKKQDVNAPSLERKNSLQTAIDCYKKWKDMHKSSDLHNPYERIIKLLLDCPELCVDSKDSQGRTALCNIVLQEKIDSSCLQIINKLINRGANIDQPIPPHKTVRSLLDEKLNEDQFADIEILADNLEDIRNGVQFHGDEIVELIAEFNKTYYGSFTALEKVREAIVNIETLRQKKSCRKTVLMAAIESDTVSFIKLLINRPDFTIVQLTPTGETPLEYARKIDAKNIIKYLSTVSSKNSGDTMQSRKRPLSTTSTAEGTATKQKK